MQFNSDVFTEHLERIIQETRAGRQAGHQDDSVGWGIFQVINDDQSLTGQLAVTCAVDDIAACRSSLQPYGRIMTEDTNFPMTSLTFMPYGAS